MFCDVICNLYHISLCKLLFCYFSFWGKYLFVRNTSRLVEAEAIQSSISQSKCSLSKIYLFI